MDVQRDYIILSIIGLPPLTGFIPKLIIISILIKHSIPTLIMLIIGSIINVFFYLTWNGTYLNKELSARTLIAS